MCRLLVVKSRGAISPEPHLRALGQIARRSKEYQGHGWGCAWLTADDRWRAYHHIMPIWEDDPARFEPTRCLVAHARSAFRDEGIAVENNMPFLDSRYAFVFNGELHGVRITESGRIGAEKIFNFIKRFDKGDMGAALARAMAIIKKRTRYIRAMNLAMVDARRVYVCTMFSEDPDYFTLHQRERDGELLISSEPYPGEDGWTALANGTVRTFG